MVEVCQTSVTMEIYKSICVCSSDLRTASKWTKQKNKYIFNWYFQLWEKFFVATFELIFKCFTSPAQGKYACTGLNEAEVAFCWSKELIPWHELLNLLEGAPCKLSRPKKVFPQIYPYQD